MKTIFRFSFIKYLIAIVVFAVIMLFLDQNDLFTQKERVEELKESEKNIVFLKNEISKMAQELDEIKENPKKVEKYAREKYLYKKDNEDVFLITTDTVYVQPTE